MTRLRSGDDRAAASVEIAVANVVWPHIAPLSAGQGEQSSRWDCELMTATRVGPSWKTFEILG